MVAVESTVLWVGSSPQRKMLSRYGGAADLWNTPVCCRGPLGEIMSRVLAGLVWCFALFICANHLH